MKVVSDSKVRLVHMELLAVKKEEPAIVSRESDYQSIIDRINEMDAKVAVYRSFPARLLRFIKRNVKKLINIHKRK